VRDLPVLDDGLEVAHVNVLDVAHRLRRTFDSDLDGFFDGVAFSLDFDGFGNGCHEEPPRLERESG
jgi:hypothetical protein